MPAARADALTLALAASSARKRLRRSWFHSAARGSGSGTGFGAALDSVFARIGFADVAFEDGAFGDGTFAIPVFVGRGFAAAFIGRIIVKILSGKEKGRKASTAPARFPISAPCRGRITFFHCAYLCQNSVTMSSTKFRIG
jgi:hypothetical protein